MFVWLRLTLQLSHNSEDEGNCKCRNVIGEHLTLASMDMDININEYCVETQSK